MKCLKLIPFLLFISCSLDPIVIQPETLGEYYAFCKLSPAFETQEVLVGKMIPESLPIAISDATVSILDLDSQTTTLFRHHRHGVYRPTESFPDIEPGHRYELHISFKDNKHLSGRAQAPDHFKIENPAKDDTVDYFLSMNSDTSRFPKTSWTNAQHARFYSVQLLPENPVFKSSPVTTYRTEIFFPELVPDIGWTKTWYDTILTRASLRIFAHDSASTFIPSSRTFWDEFSDYTEQEWQQFLNSEKNAFDNLAGGFGYFTILPFIQTEFYLNVNVHWN